MAASRIYVKRGGTNYKEKRLIEEIEKALVENNIQVTDEFQPARSLEELKTMYTKYVGKEVEYTEIKRETKQQQSTQANSGEPTSEEPTIQKSSGGQRPPVEPPTNTTQMSEESSEEHQSSQASDMDHIPEKGVDPFNKNNVKVRDYVMDTKSASSQPAIEAPQGNGNANFQEPVNFGESFEIPGQEQPSGKGKQQTGAGTSNATGAGKSTANKAEPIPPGDSGAKRRRRTMRLANSIVRGFCKITEYGFVWYTTKDITEEKLIEYELKENLDLQVVVTLDGGVQATIREFFARQRGVSADLSKISKEEQDELAEDLCEVLMEKGVELSPMNQMLVTVASIVGPKALTAFALSAQNNSVIEQLRIMRDEHVPHTEVNKDTPEGPQAQQSPAPTEPKPDAPVTSSVAEHTSPVEAVSVQDIEKALDNIGTEHGTSMEPKSDIEIGQTKETKE